MAKQDTEFVTIAESARRLGISDRQARRYAAKLGGHDRLMSAGSPTRVRLVSVADMAGRPLLNSNHVENREQDTADMADTMTGVADVTADTMTGLREDVRFLRSQLEEKDRQLASAAQEKADLLHAVVSLTGQAKMLAEDNARLRLPPAPAESDSVHAGDTTTAAAADPGLDGAQETDEDYSATQRLVMPKRGILARLGFGRRK